VGKSPEVTMGARLAALLKKEDKENPIVRVKPGVFALREWDGKKKKKGASVDEVAVEPEEAADVEVNALELEAATRAPESTEEEDEEPIEVSGEDALRADLVASGAEMFDDEEDDDQPILSSPSSTDVQRSGQEARTNGVPGEDGGRRRRRRRRRRGGRDNAEDRASGPRVEVINPTAILSVDVDSSIDTSRDPLAPDDPRPPADHGRRRSDRHRHSAGRAGGALGSRARRRDRDDPLRLRSDAGARAGSLRRRRAPSPWPARR
jgi:hypothetical protein